MLQADKKTVKRCDDKKSTKGEAKGQMLWEVWLKTTKDFYNTSTGGLFVWEKKENDKTCTQQTMTWFYT